MTPFGASVKVLHGCRQLVPGGVGLSAITSATPFSSCHRVMAGTLETLPPQGVRRVGMTSNQHGRYVRGYTRVTMGGTESGVRASLPKSLNPPTVRTGVCNPTPRSWIR